MTLAFGRRMPAFTSAMPTVVSARAMRNLAALTAAALVVGAWASAARAETAAAPAGARAVTVVPGRVAGSSPLVAWSSPEGLSRLDRVREKRGFAKLANHFEPQQNKLYCGPASATIVLNALRLGGERFRKPEDRRLFDAAAARYLPPGFDPVFARYTQETFFTLATDTVKTRLQVHGEPRPGTTTHDYGLQLRELDAMLRAHGLSTALRIVDDVMTVSRTRAELSSALAEDGAFAVVNYHRGALGQSGGGHISPLGAYDAISDSFLVMDVNPNAGPWVWVSTDALVAAMRTRDAHENRGYVVVRERNAAAGARRPPAALARGNPSLGAEDDSSSQQRTQAPAAVRPSH